MSAQKEIVFMPQWTAQAQFAGFYVAEAKGFYKEAGLNVKIKHPSLSTPNINYLIDGQCQLATLSLSQAMRYIDEGVHVVNILQILQHNPIMIISHAPLRGIESLRGKKIGYWRIGFTEIPFAMDNIHHLNIQWIPFISHNNLYISGAVDAIMAMSYNEYFQLKMSGQRMKDSQLFYFRDHGYNVPGDGLYVMASYYKNHKQEVEKFAQASRKGWEWAMEHPEEAIDIIMQYTKKNGIATNKISQEWMLEEYTRMFTDPHTGKRTYQLSPQNLEMVNKLLKKGNIIKKSVTYEQLTKP